MDRRIKFSEIVNACAEYYEIPVENIYDDFRVAAVVEARHMAMYLWREVSNEGYSSIGYRLGKTTATTREAVIGVEKAVQTQRGIKRDADAIMKIVTQNANDSGAESV